MQGFGRGISRWLVVLAALVLALGCGDSEVQQTQQDDENDDEQLNVGEETCPAGQTDCEGECRDLTIDPFNCGECGNECEDGQVCSDGNCQFSCTPGLTDCDGMCVDTDLDPDNCGECGNGCADGEVCSQGECQSECGEEFDECDGQCVATDTDPFNCGECGNECGEGEICSDGDCQLACGPGLTECDGQCVDTELDPSNCGECGTECGDGEVCADGVCGLDCGPDLTDCDGMCRDLDTDRDNCGACGQSCDDGELCSQGACQPSCGAGLSLCDDACRDLDTDPDNCGACGNECGPDEFCASGQCEPTCPDELEQCGDLCVDTSSNAAHCGGCDAACPPSFACEAETCHPISNYPQTIDGGELWLRADQGVEADGSGAVSAWQNQFDATIELTPDDASSSPEQIHQQLGNEAVIRFDGESDTLTTEDFDYPREEFTHIAVFAPTYQVDAHHNDEMILFSGDEAQAFLRPHVTLNRGDEGKLGMYLHVDGDEIDDLESDTDRWYRDHPYVITFSWDGEEAVLYVNGELEQTVSVDGLMELQEGFEISGNDGSDFFEGDLAETIIYDRALTDDEIDGLHTYAFERYHLYFEGASWLDAYSGEVLDAIEDHELAEQHLQINGYEAVDAESSCQDHLDEGMEWDGLYTIEPDEADESLVVYCEMTREEGGWTQIAHVRKEDGAPFPGQEFAGDHPHELGHSVDANGIEFSEIALTHHGLDEGDFATFELDAASEVWDSPSDVIRFKLDNDRYAIFALSGSYTDDCTRSPCTGEDIANVCINASNNDCMNESVRDEAFGALSTGTGNCFQLEAWGPSGPEGCGTWGLDPNAGNTDWVSYGGRLFLR